MPYMFSVPLPEKGTSSKANIRIFVVTTSDEVSSNKKLITSDEF